MDLSKIKELGERLGDSEKGMVEAVSGLVGGGEGGFDLSSLVNKLKEGGLGEQVSSWLGDGENAAVSGERIASALGADKLEEVASKLGIDASTAAEKLSSFLPNLLDKASSGGSLLDKFSGAEDLFNKAKGIFNK